MGLQFTLVLCLAGTFCLAPLAVYLLWMAKITRRTRPTVLAGTWDFIGLLAGLSGFIFFGGGLVISLLQSNFRYWMRGNFRTLRDAPDPDKIGWMILGLSYLVLVLGVVLFAMASRRRSLVVYNIDPAAFEAAVSEVMDHLSRPVERRGNMWFSAGTPLFELDRFVRGRTITLRWLTPDRLLFQDVDRLLREAVRREYSEDNPFSQWILAAAIGTSFGAASCLCVLAIVMRMI